MEGVQLELLAIIVSHTSCCMMAVKTSLLGADNLQIRDFVCSPVFFYYSYLNKFMIYGIDISYNLGSPRLCMSSCVFTKCIFHVLFYLMLYSINQV